MDCIIGIDAGGTKTEGQLKCLKTGKTWTFIAGPGALSYELQTAINNIINVAQHLLELANCEANKTVLVCGAAGTGCISQKQALESALKASHFSEYLVISDARTSLYGAGTGSAIIVVAIGTGSVSMRLDTQGNEKQFGGWGFEVGDQGSGAYIGRKLISTILTEYDKDDFQQTPLSEDVFNIIGNNQDRINQWVNNATPTDFAALSKLVTKPKNKSTITKEILKQAANEIEKLINTTLAGSDLPICLTGGLADTISPLLSKPIQDKIIATKGKSVDGAIYLAEQLIINSERER